MTLTAAIIGAGGIGAAHLEALSEMEGIAAVALSDVSPERAEQCAQRFGIKAYLDYRAMITETRPDIVIIALPHFLHKEASLYSLKHGCHLLIEKPMAISAAECDEILALADSKERILFVGHTQQYLAMNLRAKSIILQGGLGKLVMINDTRHKPYFTPERPAWFLDPAKSGGGIVANLGAHAIDKIQWLTDSRIVRARATLSYESAGYPDVEGSAAMLLTTSQGVPCTVNLCGYADVSHEETVLVFTNGMLKIINRKSVWLSQGGLFREVTSDNIADPLRLQFEDLLACIRDGKQPYCSGDYGRSVVRVIEAVYESHKRSAEIAVPQ
ncbi:Gfo/Idh/MocA family protein [Paenibacillus nasutitermitis]|uniref:Glucose-fructose oxidoreductase n=1 Tax=Paenibacillus nasutitermitis TaxID=1652958 RepID=A0A916YPE0_9BACL|nr:Gfo/Idh/MocA family oxidoreductase [Paenibacillus nasutitermitis]GGD52966.1 glucose-fructose oxidoreductase [Paenibacillus nasutitermitis]